MYYQSKSVGKRPSVHVEDSGTMSIPYQLSATFFWARQRLQAACGLWCRGHGPVTCNESGWDGVVGCGGSTPAGSRIKVP